MEIALVLLLALIRLLFFLTNNWFISKLKLHKKLLIFTSWVETCPKHVSKTIFLNGLVQFYLCSYEIVYICTSIRIYDFFMHVVIIIIITGQYDLRFSSRASGPWQNSSCSFFSVFFVFYLFPPFSIFIDTCMYIYI